MIQPLFPGSDHNLLSNRTQGDPHPNLLSLEKQGTQTVQGSVAVAGQLGALGGFNVGRTLVNSTPFTVLSTHVYLAVDTSGGAITLNLPATDDAAIGAGHTLFVLNLGAVNSVTITPNGANTVDTGTLTGNKGVMLVSNGGSGAAGRWEAVVIR